MSYLLNQKALQRAKKRIVNALNSVVIYDIDNVIIDSLREIGANDKIRSELIVKLKNEIKNSEQRYVTVNKDLIN